MMTSKELLQSIPEIEKKIGWKFHNHTHLLTAFVHRSYTNENMDVKEHNERMEFLGDSIFGLLVADFLYRRLPETPEGELSFLKSRLVEAASCVKFLEKLVVEKYLLLGKGELNNLGRGRESIRADLFEAIIGAIYLDGGMEAASGFLFGKFSNEIEQILSTPVSNFKAVLQDYCQKNFQNTPVYKVVSQEGPEHNKIFSISVLVNGKEFGLGKGSSKKEAEQRAAEAALEKIGEAP